MEEHQQGTIERNGTIINGHNDIENKDSADDVDVDEMVRQLSEMERIDEICIESQNGYFDSITLVMNNDQHHDMVSEVMYKHSLRFWHSNSTPDGSHTLTFKTDVDIGMKADTAIETHEQYGPSDENPMGEAFSSS